MLVKDVIEILKKLSPDTEIIWNTKENYNKISEEQEREDEEEEEEEYFPSKAQRERDYLNNQLTAAQAHYHSR